MINLMEKQKRKPRPDVVLRNKSDKQRQAVKLSHQEGKREGVYKKIGQAVSLSLIGKTGEMARRWLGDNAGYHAVHKWIYKEFGKANCCENCGIVHKKKYHWANLSGKYTREKDDWKQMCGSCHKKYDLSNNVTANKFRLP